MDCQLTRPQNAIEDEEERFLDAQLERLRLLEEMHDLELPPDVRPSLCHFIFFVPLLASPSERGESTRNFSLTPILASCQ